MRNGKRDYKREYAEYHADEKQKKNRAARNGARRILTKAGKVQKGDGKDVAHVQALSQGGSNSLANLSVEVASRNRSFAKNRKSKMISETSKRERKVRKP
jgi:hypothetical protein